jgi:hypothetical protein
MAKNIPITIKIIEFRTYYEFSRFAFVFAEISEKISAKNHVYIKYEYGCYFKDNVPNKVIINISEMDEEFDVINLNCNEYSKFKINSQDNYRLKYCGNKKSIEEFLLEHKLRSDLLNNEDFYFAEQLDKVLFCEFKMRNDCIINETNISVNYICFKDIVFSYKKLSNGNFLVKITNNDVELIPKISGKFVSFKKVG